MIAGINPEELVLLKFSKEETQTKLRWEHSKEFEYDGQMYDIVSKEVKGDSIFYRCWWDHEETKLNKKLQILVANALNEDEDKRKFQLNLHNYFFSFFCTDLSNWQATPLQNFEIETPEVMHVTKFSAIRLTPPKPPPKLS